MTKVGVVGCSLGGGLVCLRLLRRRRDRLARRCGGAKQR